MHHFTFKLMANRRSSTSSKESADVSPLTLLISYEAIDRSNICVTANISTKKEHSDLPHREMASKARKKSC